jgi:uncharacterized protein (DUF4415 family)
MKDNYDFSKGKRGAVMPPPPGKTRITLWLDNEIIAGFRQRAGDKGAGYQTEINRVLREVLSGERVTLEAIRDIVRRELRASA